MTEIEQNTGIESLVNLSREEAAGGICSLRVLQLINMVGKAERENPQIGTLVATETCELEQQFQSFTNTKQVGEVGELVTLQTDDDGPIRVAYRNRHTNRMVELWNFVEKNQNSGNCSYAVFVPAMNEELDIDFSMIVTENDEQSLTSQDEVFNGSPRTNAKVLDKLIDCFRDRSDMSGKILGELIDIDKLASQFSLDELPPSLPVDSLINLSEPVDPLARQLGRLSGWLEMEGKNKKFKYSKTYDRSVIHGELDNESRLKTTIQHTDLGLDGRIVQLGSIGIVNGDVVVNSDSGHEDVLRQTAEELLKVPEIIADENLLDQIQNIVINTTDATHLSNEIATLLKNFKEENSEKIDFTDKIIDMGVLDLRGLDANLGDHVFSRFSGVRATIIVNVDMIVFAGSYNLYECCVVGANHAFNNTQKFIDDGKFAYPKGLVRCSAINVRKAFNDCGNLTDCFVDNALLAFRKVDTAKGCVAQNCKTAFETTYSENCMARDCSYVFEGGKATNCIAEHCKTSFFAVSAKGCRVVNPKLLGTNFWRSDFDWIGGTNKINGRVLGKRASRLRGKYRK